MSPCTKDEVADIVGGLDSGKAIDIPISLLNILNNGIFPNI